VNHNRRKATEPAITTFLLPQCPLPKKKKKKTKTKVDNNTIHNVTATLGLLRNDTTLLTNSAGNSGSDGTGPPTTTLYCSLSSLPRSLTRFISTRLFFDDGTACMLLLILGYVCYSMCFRLRNYLRNSIMFVQQKRADARNKHHRKKLVNSSVNRKNFVNSVKNLVQMERVLSGASTLTSQTSSQTTTTPTTKKRSKILLTNSRIHSSKKTNTSTSTRTSFSCMKDPMSVNRQNEKRVTNCCYYFPSSLFANCGR